MTPGTFILRLRRGDYYRRRFRFQNTADMEYLDFDGYTGLAQIRATEDSAVLIEATVTVGTDATSPYVEVFFSNTDTATLEGGTYRWDLELSNGDGPLTWLAGDVVVTKDVSRAP